MQPLECIQGNLLFSEESMAAGVGVYILQVVVCWQIGGTSFAIANHIVFKKKSKGDPDQKCLRLFS